MFIGLLANINQKQLYLNGKMMYWESHSKANESSAICNRRTLHSKAIDFMSSYDESNYDP